MKHQPFKSFINVAPKGYKEMPEIEYRYENDIRSTLASLDIETELHCLESHLFSLNGSDRFLYTKLILQDLINTYFNIRQRMSPDEDENKKLQRDLMLEVYNAIVGIITLLHRMEIVIPQEFIADYERRDKTGIIIEVIKMFLNENQNDTLTIINQSKTEQKPKQIQPDPNPKALEGKYKYIKGKPNYLEKYLDEVSEYFNDIRKQPKKVIAAIALILYEKQLFDRCTTYKSVLLCCCEYWGCIPPVDTKQKPYDKLKCDYIKNHVIFNNNPKEGTN